MWLDSAISIVSRLFDLILLRLLEYLGFLSFEGLSWLSISISSNLFSVLIIEICDLYLLNSFFQGDLFFGVSGRLLLLSNFFGGGLLGFVVIVGMLGICWCLGWVFVGLGIQLHWSEVRSFSLDLVQHWAWLSFPLVILVVFSILLFVVSYFLVLGWVVHGFGYVCINCWD